MTNLAIHQNLGPPEKGAIAVSTVPVAVLLAAKILPQTLVTAWVTAHALPILVGSTTLVALALASAAYKESQPPPNLERRLVAWQPPAQTSYAAVFRSIIANFPMPQFVRAFNPPVTSFFSTPPFIAPLRPPAQQRIAPLLLTNHPHSHRCLDLSSTSVIREATPKPRSTEEVKEALTTYLKDHSPTLKLDDALVMAREGGKLCQTLLKGGEAKPTKQNALYLIWHLTLCQIIKEGEASEEWMWKIEDPDGRLTQFFQSVEGCRERISSHFKGLSKGSHKGFDIDRTGMPAQKGHALVIALDPEAYGGKTFLGLKPENYGVETFTDTVMHGYEFVIARSRKLFPGMDEAEGMRKEHLPACFKRTGKKRVCELTKSGEAAIKERLKRYSDLEVRDGNEVIMMLTDLEVDYSSWEIKNNLEDSFVFTNMPQTEAIGGHAIRPDRPINLPGLIPSVMENLQDHEAASRQITRDLLGTSLAIEGVPFSGKTALELIEHLKSRLNLTESLARKVACLLTQTCMPEISQAVGTNAPFPHEDPQTAFLMERDEHSSRVVQDSKGLQFTVTREEDRIEITAHIAFDIKHPTRSETMAVTLNMDPLTDQAHYIITLGS